MPPRTRKPAEEPATTTGVEVTHPLRALLLDLAEVFTKHANALPLTTGITATINVNGSADAADETVTESAAEVEVTKPAARGRKATKAAPKQREPEPEPEAEAEEPGEAEAMSRAEYREQLTAMDDEELRALAVSMEWDPNDVAGAEAADIIQAILDELYPGETDEEPAAEEPTDDLDDDGTGGESNGITRDELMEMNLPTLRKFAKQLQIPDEEITGKDKDALADVILSYQEGGDAEGEESGGLTEEAAEDMSRGELWAIVTAPESEGGLGYSPPKTATREQLLGWVVAAIRGEEPTDPPF